MVYVQIYAGKVLSKATASLSTYCTPDDRNETPPTTKYMVPHSKNILK